MAGVAGPLLRRDRGAGVRFLVGLTAGGIISGLLISLVVLLVGALVRAVVPVHPRMLLLAFVCVALGLADLLDRTPHPWRQVPQSMIHQMSPGLRGIAWGVDL